LTHRPDFITQNLVATNLVATQILLQLLL